MLRYYALFLLLLPTLAITQPIFTTGGTFYVGSSPGSIAVADFNGDGRLDLATANYGDNTVTVLVGDGSGGFTSNGTFATDSGPIQVIAADFNQDGNVDLAVLNSLSNSLTVLIGDGSGRFTAAPGSPLPVGTSPTSLVVADFNLDGLPDLAVAFKSGLVLVYLGNANGGFTVVPTPAFPAGQAPVSIAAADFNGDGNPDLVVLQSGVGFPPPPTTYYNVLLGTGDGGFTLLPVQTLLAPAALFSLAVGDFNGDGKPDVAAVDQLTGDGYLLLSGFQSGLLLGGGPLFGAGGTCYSIATADFNNDGTLDVALANYGAGNVDVDLTDRAALYFAPMAGSPFAAGPRPLLAVGDFNGDGKADIAVASSTANSVTILLNNGIGTTPQTITFPPLNDLVYNGTGISISATATSGLPVFFRALLQNVCGVVGNTVVIFSSGTCTVIASQYGDAAYAPAAPVTQSFTIYPGSQTITFPSPGTRTLGFPPDPVPLSAKSSAPILPSYVSDTPDVCRIYANDSAVLVSEGTCTITATAPPTPLYVAAAPVTVSFSVVARMLQTITFTAPSTVAFGTIGVKLTATASSGLPVFFTYSSPICQVDDGGILFTISIGPCVVTAAQEGNATFSPATPVTTTITITKGPQTITFAPIPDRPLSGPPFYLSAIASSSLPVTFVSTTMAVCTVSEGNKVTLQKVGTCSITASQDGNSNYLAAPPVMRTFVVAAL